VVVVAVVTVGSSIDGSPHPSSHSPLPLLYLGLYLSRVTGLHTMAKSRLSMACDGARCAADAIVALRMRIASLEATVCIQVAPFFVCDGCGGRGAHQEFWWRPCEKGRGLGAMHEESDRPVRRCALKGFARISSVVAFFFFSSSHPTSPRVPVPPRI